jgi:hypothetical protein
MEREEIQISTEDLRDIVYDDHEDWQEVESSVDGHWRHGTEHTGVFRRLIDGKFFRMDWRDSVKDECWWEDMNYGCTAKEVFPKEVITTVYE